MNVAALGLSLTAAGLILGACATAGTPATRAATDEKAFASTFASCRAEVRAGKTTGFKRAPMSPAATGATPGDTRLTLKAPYDKSMARSKATRRGHDQAFRVAMDQCLGDNGYDTRPFNATRS